MKQDHTTVVGITPELFILLNNILDIYFLTATILKVALK